MPFLVTTPLVHPAVAPHYLCYSYINTHQALRGHQKVLIPSLQDDVKCAAKVTLAQFITFQREGVPFEIYLAVPISWPRFHHCGTEGNFAAQPLFTWLLRHWSKIKLALICNFSWHLICPEIVQTTWMNSANSVNLIKTYLSLSKYAHNNNIVKLLFFNIVTILNVISI